MRLVAEQQHLDRSHRNLLNSICSSSSCISSSTSSSNTNSSSCSSNSNSSSSCSNSNSNLGMNPARLLATQTTLNRKRIQFVVNASDLLCKWHLMHTDRCLNASLLCYVGGTVARSSCFVAVLGYDMLLCSVGR